MEKKLLIVVVLTLLSLNIFAQTIPEPTGPYMIGTTSFIIEDESREESFTEFVGDFRKLMVKAWYPAEVTNEARAPYITDNFKSILLNRYKIPSAEVEQLGLSNSYINAPLNRSEDEYPVIIYAHGFGSTENDNTIMMEELASQGFIVYSINFSYYSLFSIYEGEFIANYKFNDGLPLEEKKRLYEEMGNVLKAVKAADDPAEKQRLTAELNRTNKVALIYGDVSRIWLEDTLFFIETLDEVDESNELLNSLREMSDKDNIGMLGYSFGGNTAALLCLLEDSPLKAGINMDGKVNPPAAEGYEEMQGFAMETPFLFMSQDSGELSGVMQQPYFYGAEEDVYSLIIKDTTHANFTSLSYFPSLRKYSITGKLSSAAYTEIMRGTIVPFFNTYLKDDEEAMESSPVQWRSDVTYQKRND